MTASQGKDPDDPNQSPRTVAARKHADDAEARAAAAERRLSEMEPPRSAAQPLAPDAPSAPGPPWPVYVAATLLTLGAAGSLYYVYLLKGHRPNRAAEAQPLHTPYRARDCAEPDRLEQLSYELRKTQDSMGRLREEFEELRAALLYAAAAPVALATRAAAAPLASAAQEDAPFPVSANEYALKAGGRAEVVRRDALSNTLIKDPDGRGPLLLVEDAYAPEGLCFIAPRVAYLQTGDEYHYHYERFFDCDHPSAGDVWIVRPGVVEPAGGGWRLRDRGALEIR